ncbi:hypothetical protein L873DRAFT_200237 [Choiromyces venosus 120613-1]|uniref:Uncharacterized protein n=1 Tax=Choiromyces venosus 120613-1 TaxID=1336337 RepID=A0A3N4J6Q5_9PEZI|nr:hypothetical protein L873DRAFT_200237 [Choiromyces venosus 120613-1]
MFFVVIIISITGRHLYFILSISSLMNIRSTHYPHANLPTTFRSIHFIHSILFGPFPATPFQFHPLHPFHSLQSIPYHSIPLLHSARRLSGSLTSIPYNIRDGGSSK